MPGWATRTSRSGCSSRRRRCASIWSTSSINSACATGRRLPLGRCRTGRARCRTGIALFDPELRDQRGRRLGGVECVEVVGELVERLVLRGSIADLVQGPTLYALWVSFTTRRQRQADNAIIGALIIEQRRDVLHAAGTGSPPGEPALRPAATAMVRNRLIEHDRHPTLPTVGLGVFLALSTLLAVTDGLWYLAGTTVFGWALIWAVRYPGQLRQCFFGAQNHFGAHSRSGLAPVRKAAGRLSSNPLSRPRSQSVWSRCRRR